MLVSLFAVPLGAGAADNDAGVPELKSISFKNATIDTGFKGDVLEYTITLEDNTVSPTLESFEAADKENPGELFVTYITDEAGHQTGIKAELSSSTGSGVNYVFLYSNPAEYEINSNNYLSDIYSPYAELEESITHDSDSYRLYIPKDLTTLTVTPVTEDINASCPQLNLTLNDDKTIPITLNCTASDGSVRTYKIKIKRVDKTLDEVKEEMQQEGYTTFVTGTRFYENTSFYVIAGSALGGLIVLFALYKAIRRFAVSPYDPQEKPFYSTAE